VNEHEKMLARVYYGCTTAVHTCEKHCRLLVDAPEHVNNNFSWPPWPSWFRPISVSCGVNVCKTRNSNGQKVTDKKCDCDTGQEVCCVQTADFGGFLFLFGFATSNLKCNSYFILYKGNTLVNFMKHVNKIFRVHYYSMARHWLGDGQHSRYIYKYSSTQFSDQFGNFSYSYYIIFRRSETTDDLSVHLSALKHKIAPKRAKL